MKHIAVIGGGISGLTAAWQLTQLDQSCTLFEASARVGGIVETERRDGFVIECGPDSWVAEKPWARELAIELGLEDEIIASNDFQRRTWLLRDGQLLPMPDGMRMMVPTRLDALEGSPLFSQEAIRAYAAEPSRAEGLRASALPEGQDESVASFVRRHFGDEVTRTIAAPLLAGVFGGDVEQLSVRSVMAPFVKMEQEHGSLIAALNARPPKPGHGGTSIFGSLRSGLGTLAEKMSEALPTASVHFETPVQALAREGGQWRVSTTQGSGLFDAVLLATPANATRALLARLDAAAAALLPVEASSAIVVALAYDRAAARHMRVPEGFGYLVPPPQAGQGPSAESLLACTFVDQKFPHRAPDGCVLLRAFFGGDAAERLLHAPESELITRAEAQLAVALGPLPAPAFSLVRRWPLSLPQYATGHLDRMRELEARVAQLPGLTLLGNAYHGVGLPDLIRQARSAARALVAPEA
ncbi:MULTISPECIES: protoporphyrinogen oxidase [Acidobacterium]|uniref:Coproporphyrinogen III oxidase n=1 Tax=Acidobacterium capsulatum (strain ATCC 51196 / DSM 11244 / BCRC 80197 / JCM 7670 / NBRC 15755 / NCIMB 13165 / 161) TaxID=240015 RepID=C1F1C8_ACIC5|nr:MULTISPECIES: protoporphyrinogen oxidase [Acidobacterium]ACO34126.1 protoporphyrinogen oxidase [Acidobacterium capsulatum ATCC 51196]HCT62456.1 protoporphyrinogen oxidase [Acidobacterium sp.]